MLPGAERNRRGIPASTGGAIRIRHGVFDGPRKDSVPTTSALDMMA